MKRKNAAFFHRALSAISLCAITFISSEWSWAQNLTPQQQKELIEQAEQLKEQVRQLKQKDDEAGESGASPTGGLKTTDMKNTSTEDADKKNPVPADGGGLGGISSEQRQELMENIKKIKDNKEASDKELERLMKDDE